jgi:hypothetical protein
MYTGFNGETYESQAHAWEYGQAPAPAHYRAGYTAAGALLALLASGLVYGAYQLGGTPLGVGAIVLLAVLSIFAAMLAGG